MKPPLRIKSVSTKVSEAEFAMLEERARSSGLTLSEWVRDALLAAPVDVGPDSGEVVLAELLALRSLFLNLQFRADKAPLTEVELRGLIDRGAANQRSGVLGSLNMVADAFKLLPKEAETERRWSTVEWAKERKGWVLLVWIIVADLSR